jgi:penicillin-binding protein 1A
MTVFTWKGEDTIMTPWTPSKLFLLIWFDVYGTQTGNIKAWVGGINYKYSI